jgi:hypothetical protein
MKFLLNHLAISMCYRLEKSYPGYRNPLVGSLTSNILFDNKIIII